MNKVTDRQLGLCQYLFCQHKYCILQQSVEHGFV